MIDRNNKEPITYRGMQIGQFRVILENWFVISPNIYVTALTFTITTVPALCQPLIVNTNFIEFLEYIS